MSVNRYNSTTGKLERIAGGTLYADAPIGTISPFGGSVIPSGYLLCNGAEVLKTAYAELYAVIGDAFGTASDNTKFKLPDLRETAPVGTGTRKSGVTSHDTYTLGQFKDDQLQNHKHTTTSSGSMSQIYSTAAGHMGSGNVLTATGQWDSTAANQFTFTKSISVSGTSGNPTTGSHGTVTRGKRLGVNYIIKAKQVAVPADFAPVDVIENGNMKAVTSNAVYDELKKVQSQTYECSGFLVNALAGEITGYGRATIILRDGIAEIKFSVRIQTNDGPSTFNWGLNRDLLHTLLPDLPVITPIGNNSNLQFFAGTGSVLVDLMGYGAMASAVNQFWVPARMYQTDGSTGTWGSGQFPINSYITGTVYGAYAV